jgi:hypothetical protein
VERAVAEHHEDWTLLRVAIPDRPGGFAMLTRCLAACGVDILAAEIVGRRSGSAMADVLVHGGDLERALRALDADIVLLGRRAHGDLPDPGVAMADACTAVGDGAAPERILQAALALVGADAGALYRAADLAPLAATTEGLTAIAQEARDAGAAVFAEPAAGSTLAMPFGPGGSLVLALGRPLPFPFQDAEVDRLTALGRFASPAV